MRYSTRLVFAVLLVSTATAETGLMQLPGGEGVCSDSVLMYTCVTTGRGATELILDDMPLFEFPHGRYEGGEGVHVNETRLAGDIIAGNLSRSTDVDCFDTLDNVMDYCYTTRIVVHLTEHTRCRTIRCRTRFRTTMDELIEFGNTNLTRVLPAPINIGAVYQSMDAATFSWDPGSLSCTNILYSVSTTNCGTCSGSFNTYDRNITCEDLSPDQECRVSVRSSLECGVFSDPITYTFTVLQSITTTTTKEGSNTGALVGGVIGGVLGGVIPIVLVIIVAVVVVVHRRKMKSKNIRTDDCTGGSTAERGQQNTVTPPENEEPQEIVSEIATANDASNDHVTGESLTDDHTITTNGQPMSPDQSVLSETKIGDCLIEDHTITTNGQPISPDQSILSETKETIPLLPVKHDSSATVSQPTTEPVLQSSDELKTPEQSSEDIQVQQTMFVTGHQAATNGANSHYDETPPAIAISRGAEHLIGSVAPVVPFNAPMESLTEEGRLEQSMDGYVGNESQSGYHVPTGKEGFGLSDGGKLLTQVASRSNSGSKVTSQPVEDSAPSQTVGISNKSGAPAILSNKNKSASEDHGYDVVERIIRLEDAKREQDDRIDKQDIKIDKQDEKICELQTEVKELNKTLGELRLRYDELEKKSTAEQQHHEEEKKQLLQEIQSLKTALKLKEARIRHLENQGYRCSTIKKEYRRYDSYPA